MRLGRLWEHLLSLVTDRACRPAPFVDRKLCSLCDVLISFFDVLVNELKVRAVTDGNNIGPLVTRPLSLLIFTALRSYVPA
jgi:hypothetical protein